MTEMAAAECGRVLSPGGKLAAVEPWRASLYAIGTKLFGKREHAACQPMDPNACITSSVLSPTLR